MYDSAVTSRAATLCEPPSLVFTPKVAGLGRSRVSSTSDLGGDDDSSAAGRAPHVGPVVELLEELFRLGRVEARVRVPAFEAQLVV